MSKITTVAIDAMGGDHGPSVTVPAALHYLAADPEVAVILVGRQDELRAALSRHHAAEHARLHIHHAEDVVGMDEQPQQALRHKKQSSMRIALDLVKSGEANACVSAGNTGALMAMSRFVLKMMPGIERPAIATILPTMRGHVHMLDLGANVDCTPLHLYQFAVMGSILVSAVESVERPTIGLLNIGEEAIKGNEVVRQTYGMLKESSLNFVGNVEGNEVYQGRVQVVVCDGFVGNVLLKTSEGVAQMIAGFLREEFTRNLFTKLVALLARPVIGALRRRADHRCYNGAALLGLKGVVVKSHGSADAFAFEQAIRRAADAVRNDVLARIEQQVAASVIEGNPA